MTAWRRRSSIIDNPLTLDGEKPIADVSSMAEIVVQTMREHARLESGDVTISATSWETFWFAVFHLKEMIDDLHERYHRD